LVALYLLAVLRDGVLSSIAQKINRAYCDCKRIITSDK
jgi:hypothetical protein